MLGGEGLSGARAFFDDRAYRYLGESAWITDIELVDDLVEPLQGMKKVLDVCSGPSVLADAARHRDARTVALDLSLRMLMQGPADIARVCGDAQSLPFQEKCFDTALCRQGLHYAQNPRGVVEEMIRVTKGEVRFSNVVMLQAEDLPFWESYAYLVTPARRQYFLQGDLARLATHLGCDVVRHRIFEYSTSVAPSVQHLDPDAQQAVRDLFLKQPDHITSSYQIRPFATDVSYVVRWESVHARVPDWPRALDSRDWERR
ncbi:methyltransferase domain-containing protein [Micromonospora sp. NPDC048905]|uniref:class I SAM-dependent methyltransferase n=1 Tax=Micromonospora sp. NPDC048905 TaxID=3155494 RepID=UPI0033F87B7F